VRVANRICEDVRAIGRRWKSEEKSKGHARPRVSGGEAVVQGKPAAGMKRGLGGGGNGGGKVGERRASARGSFRE